MSLWTHNLNDSSIITKYNGSSYHGPAVKLGSGISGGAAYQFVGNAGYRLIGGECPTVGVAGGYTSGGGHSMLNSAYGMAADNVLEWEVVTTSGEHLIATPDQNSDLYWALSGGGAGTFAVVVSMTTKIFQEGIVGGASLTFNETSVGNTTFWEGMGKVFSFLPSLVDTGSTVSFQVDHTSFQANSITIPDRGQDEVDEIMAPVLADLDALNIPYSYSSRVSDTYFDHVQKDIGPLPWGHYPVGPLFSNRLFPRNLIENDESNADIMAAMSAATESGDFLFGCHAVNVKNATHPDNAVLPQWRDTIAICIAVGLWDYEIPQSEMLDRKQYLVDTILPSLEEATPGAGTYLNEVDPLWKADWKQELYGVNYPRLLEIKEKYDPDHVLHGHFAVGGDYWVPDASGRLCHA